MPISLCLGTAQFGLNYGVTNKKGIVEVKEVQEILDKAYDQGIKFLDTAKAYGNAEEVLGKSIRKSQEFKIISKISLPEKISSDQNLRENLYYSFNDSLKKLNRENLHTLLIHRPKDLYSKYSSTFIKWLISLKNEGLLARIGVSIYNFDEISKIDLSIFDVVQIPLSLFDQRFLKNNQMEKILNSNCQIHIRSIFLQGLLLCKNSFLPKFLSKEFLIHHSKFCAESKKHQLSQLEYTLSFVKSLKNVEAALIGIENLEQLKEIIDAWDQNYFSKIDNNFSKFNWDNISDIDPRLWN